MKIKKSEASYDKNIVELFEIFDERRYSYSYLPTDLLEKNKILLEELNRVDAFKKAQ